MHTRRFAVVGLGAFAAMLGACQLVSGLSGYQASGGGATTSTATSSAGSTGSSGGTGGTSSSSSGTGGASTSSSGMTSSSSGTLCQAGTLCGSNCVELMSDPANCGKCGFRCDADPLAMSPACKVGYCSPVPVVAPTYDAVVAISATDTAVYWVGRTSTTYEVSQALSPLWKPNVVWSGNTVTAGIAVVSTGTYAYMTQQNTAGAASLWKVGSTLTPLSGDVGLNTAGPVVLYDNTHVFWVANDTVSGHPVLLGTDTGNPMTAYSRHVPGTSGTLRVAASASATKGVYYNDGVTFGEELGTGDNPVKMAGSPVAADPRYLALDAAASGYLYWIDPSTAMPRLLRIGRDGTPSATSYPVKVPTGLAAIAAPYWLDGVCTDPAGSQLSTVKWGDPTPAPVATGLLCPDNLTADGSKYVYFSAQDATQRVGVYRILVP